MKYAKGHEVCEEIRQKLSLAAKRQWIEQPDLRQKLREANLGKHISQETIAKIVAKTRGLKRSKVAKDNIRIGLKKYFSEHPEAGQKISEREKGRIISLKQRRVISEANKGRIGELSGNWKGDRAGYTAIHIWIRKHKEQSLICERCGEIPRKLEISNISGKYLRDINDYEWLCTKCHKTKDRSLFWSRGIYPFVAKVEADGD